MNYELRRKHLTGHAVPEIQKTMDRLLKVIEDRDSTAALVCYF